MQCPVCLLLASLLTVPAVGQKAPPEPTRPISIVVTVLNDKDKPLAECPMSAMSRNDGAADLTDAAGVVTVQIGVSDLETLVYVGPAFNATVATSLSVEDVIQRYMQYTADYYFARALEIPINATDDIYTITFPVYPAVTLSGTLVDPSGDPILNAGVAYLGGTRFGIADATIGEFEVSGIRQASDGIFAIGQARPTEYSFVDLDIADTSVSHDLGPITVGRAITSETVHLSIEPPAPPFVSIEAEIKAGCTLIAEDGSRAFDLLFREDLALIQEYRASEDPVLAPGVYFIAPGSALNSRLGAKVVAMTRAGQAAALHAAGVPSIEILPAEPDQSFVLDLNAAEKAILGLRNKPID